MRFYGTLPHPWSAIHLKARIDGFKHTIQSCGVLYSIGDEWKLGCRLNAS